MSFKQGFLSFSNLAVMAILVTLVRPSTSFLRSLSRSFPCIGTPGSHSSPVSSMQQLLLVRGLRKKSNVPTRWSRGPRSDTLSGLLTSLWGGVEGEIDPGKVKGFHYPYWPRHINKIICFLPQSYLQCPFCVKKQSSVLHIFIIHHSRTFTWNWQAQS